MHRCRNLIQRIRALHPARRSDNGPESGQAMVEFGLVLPILVVFIVLILDFGRAVNYWIDTTHLASEGARLAAVDRVPDGGSLQDYMRGQADTKELREGSIGGAVEQPIEVCVNYFEAGTDNATTNPHVGDRVEVTVHANYDWMPLFNKEWGLSASTISGSASHRVERVEGNVSAGCTS